MRLPSVNTKGAIPVLPLLGMLILAIGIGVSISLARQPQDSGAKASDQQVEETIIPSATHFEATVSASPSDTRRFSNLLQP